MPTYVLPQVLVFQEFTTVPAAAANPLRAHISGPHAKLIRYAEADERNLGRLGYYDSLVDTTYQFPERPAGGIVDPTYTKLWMKDALLRYFSDAASAGSTITKTAGYSNRIRSATISFADHGSDYPRSDELYDRDVAPGDIVRVRGVKSDMTSVTLWTYVRDLVGDTVDSTIAAADTDEANPASQSQSSSVVQISGAENCVTLTPSASAYDGYTSGYVTETYDIVVTGSSTGGDYTTALLRVISGSGEDDQIDVVPAAAGSPTDIGTRGLTVTFNEIDTLACSASATVDGVSADDLIVGQRWRVTVHGTFTKPVPTSGGTYDGTVDTTYVVTVTRGGLYSGATLPQITVSTTTGVDVSGPTEVSGASTAVDVGTHGVTIEFTGTGLRKGDRYYIDVTGITTGALRTIVLGHSLDSDIPDGSEVDLDLYIRKTLLEIPQNREGFAPITNWDVTDTEITVNSGIIAYDETWTDGGVPQALDVFAVASKSYGELFVEVRYWLSDLCNTVDTISDIADIDQISGVLHPDNPLKWGVFKALENCNGTEVKYTSVCDPDSDDSWADVLALLLGRTDVYGLVPLTRRQTVLDLFIAHATDQATPDQALWRVVWANLEGIPEIPIVSAGSSVRGHTTATTTDGEVALGTVSADPDATDTQYTIVRCTSANADFLTNGVRAGDVVRLLYTTDGFGGSTYSEFVVDTVISEDELRLISGPDVAISVAAKFEVWRTLTPTEEAEAIAVNAGSFGDRRVRATWPDLIESSGTIQEGYFLNCALAGLASGVLPQQSLTHVAISGFTDVPRTTLKFNRSQLDRMAIAGTWIVTQDLTGNDTALGQIYTRHAVTTGSYEDINQREEAITRNVDSISYRFKDALKVFIGVTNVTPLIQTRIDLECGNLIRTLQSEGTINLGGQVLDGTIVSVRPHVTYRDRFVVKLTLVVPYATNNIELHLSV